MLSLSQIASAATITATAANRFYEDFTIEFTDLNGDRLLSVNEVDSFSGVPGTSKSYNYIGDVATIAGFSSSSGDPDDPADAYMSWYWWFAEKEGDTAGRGAVGFASNNWTYTTSIAPALVPLPAGGALLLSALGAAGLLRRRKKVV